MTLKDLNNLARKAKVHPEHLTVLIGGNFTPRREIVSAEVVDDFYLLLDNEEGDYIEDDDD